MCLFCAPLAPLLRMINIALEKVTARVLVFKHHEPRELTDLSATADVGEDDRGPPSSAKSVPQILTITRD